MPVSEVHALKPMMGHRKEVRLKVFYPKEECGVWLSTREFHRDACRNVERSLAVWFSPETARCVDQTAGARSADYLRFVAEAEMRAVDPDECLDMDDSDADDVEAIPDRVAVVLTGPRVHLEDDPMSSSAKRAHAIPLPVSRILTQPDIEMEAVPVPVPEDAMEVDFGAGVEPVLVRRGAKRASTMC